MKYQNGLRIVVTGSNGFIGRNLISALREHEEFSVVPVSRETTSAVLNEGLATADLVYHLAGVNRPETPSAFEKWNAEFTAEICNRLLDLGRAVPVVFTSSVQAVLDNPYGLSKRHAEDAISIYAEKSGAPAAVYRLTNVFGKWCRPNYNSVVATFCYNIARDLPVTISDPKREIELAYVGDVVRHFVQHTKEPRPGGVFWPEVKPVYKISLRRLADSILGFRETRRSLRVPSFSDSFTQRLYATFLSYLAPDDFAYGLEQKCDARGCLAEFVKSASFGQVFVSRTLPGVTRGNHYHNTKTEKFLVLEGEAIVRFRSILDNKVVEYHVAGKELRVVDIPPGYTHSIENIGTSELVTLFWASEIFDSVTPDTIGLAVIGERP